MFRLNSLIYNLFKNFMKKTPFFTFFCIVSNKSDILYSNGEYKKEI